MPVGVSVSGAGSRVRCGDPLLGDNAVSILERRLTDENQHPDTSVEKLAMESLVDPNNDRIVFTSTAVEDRFELYLAHGVTAVDEVPAVIQRISEDIVVGVTDLAWADTNVLRFWRDGYDCTQEMTLSDLIYKPVVSAETPHPDATSDGGET